MSKSTSISIQNNINKNARSPWSVGTKTANNTANGEVFWIFFSFYFFEIPDSIGWAKRPCPASHETIKTTTNV
jgi:hypothetical protein